MALVLLKLTLVPLAISFDTDIKLDWKEGIYSISSISICYESPRKEIVSYVFEHLIHNIKSYNGVEI